MPLDIVKLTLGPAQTNAYLAASAGGKEAVAIDPSWDGDLILEAAKQRNWRITNIWLTHAHFDHFGGAAAVADGSSPPPPRRCGRAPRRSRGQQPAPPRCSAPCRLLAGARERRGQRLWPAVRPRPRAHHRPGAGANTSLGRNRIRGSACPWAYAWACDVLCVRRKADVLWRCHLPNVHRPHRFAARRPAHADQKHPARSIEPASRNALAARPWARDNCRAGTGIQSL